MGRAIVDEALKIIVSANQMLNKHSDQLLGPRKRDLMWQLVQYRDRHDRATSQEARDEIWNMMCSHVASLSENPIEEWQLWMLLDIPREDIDVMLAPVRHMIEGQTCQNIVFEQYKRWAHHIANKICKKFPGQSRNEVHEDAELRLIYAIHHYDNPEYEFITYSGYAIQRYCVRRIFEGKWMHYPESDDVMEMVLKYNEHYQRMCHEEARQPTFDDIVTKLGYERKYKIVDGRQVPADDCPVHRLILGLQSVTTESNCLSISQNSLKATGIEVCSKMVGPRGDIIDMCVDEEHAATELYDLIERANLNEEERDALFASVNHGDLKKVAAKYGFTRTSASNRAKTAMEKIRQVARR